MSASETEAVTRSLRFDVLLAEYEVRRDEGQAVDREQFIREHPEFENELRKQFTVSERVDLANAIMAEERAAAKERKEATQFGSAGGDQVILTGEKGKARKFAAQRAGLSSPHP